MRVEIINTGTELLVGRVLNTHQQWLCRQLHDQGYEVVRQTCVADSGPRVREAVAEALARAEIVITTGGLGPTSDDLTREEIAGLLGRNLRRDEGVARHIADYFERRLKCPPHRTEVQAMVPEGARVLPNAHGTAPGLVMEMSPSPFSPAVSRSCLVMLPGPPRELRPMFSGQLLPWLMASMPSSRHPFTLILRTTGLGESALEEQISEPLAPWVGRGLEIGYCARVGEVDLRLAACGSEARRLVEEAAGVVEGLIGPEIFGRDEVSLEQVVVGLLAERGETVAVAESCTGGALAHRLTRVPGASAVFPGGVVSYSNELKQELLGVRAETLRRWGAVSEAVAREMAEGARRVARASCALAITGIAGPSGGSEEKPVGTVFLALATARTTQVQRRCNAYERETFQEVTTQQALDLLRRALLAGTARGGAGQACH